MNCLVIAATVFEIKPLLEWLQKEENPNPALQIDVLITGIGLTATTYALQKQLSFKKPHLVIQAGVGGCFLNEAPLGKVFLIQKETIADQSVIELDKLKTLFDLALVPADQYPYKNRWLINGNPLLKKIRLPKVKGISVNEITTDLRKVKLYQKQFAPVIESMEGAALHYVCLQENIPFLQLRSTSNYIAERNKKNWNMQQSIVNLNKELLKILQSL
jgi:futalosine hydrolase